MSSSQRLSSEQAEILPGETLSALQRCLGVFEIEEVIIFFLDQPGMENQPGAE